MFVCLFGRWAGRSVSLLPILLPVCVTACLLAGCGGSSTSYENPAANMAPQTVTVIGLVEDETTQTPLTDGIVTVQGTTLSGVTDVNGRFILSGVTIGTITLNIKDSIGTSQGRASVDLANFTGSTRDIGIIPLDHRGMPTLPSL